MEWTDTCKWIRAQLSPRGLHPKVLDVQVSASVPIAVYVRFARVACHRTGLAESSTEDTAELC
jgi:hypothetical protein